MVDPPVAYIVMAHTDPGHVRRLIRALPDGPVFLHCDSSTPTRVFSAMVEGVGRPVVLLPRRRTRWGSWAIVMAEIDGYRAALRRGVRHCVLLSGSDYPLAPKEAIASTLAALPEAASLLDLHPLPRADWGPTGGYFRLYHRWATIRGRSVRPFWRRSLLPGLRYTSASQWKVISRAHAEALIRVVDGTPDVRRFFSGALVPDELFVATVLQSEVLVGSLTNSVIDWPAWFIDWPVRGADHPRWLQEGDLLALLEAAAGSRPALFGRKISATSTPGLVAALDRHARQLEEAAGPRQFMP